MISSDQQKKIRNFWEWFRNHEADFGNLKSTQQDFWDIALGELKRIDRGLWFELSAHDEKPRELIIFAEGNVELFPLIDNLVAEAPILPEWKFIALKPPRGFEFQMKFEDIPLNPAQMYFQPILDDSNPNFLRLEIAVSNFDAADESRLLTGLIIILETGLGERCVAEEIQDVQVIPLQEHHKNEFIELRRVGEYLKWRKAKLAKHRHQNG